MKRHNFKGLRSSHGVSVSHRSHGSTGQCQDPGRVFRGKKMAGHMGCARVTVQNLQVLKTDIERGLVFVKGSVPGAKGGWVFLQDACKRPLPENAPRPAALGTQPKLEPKPEAKLEVSAQKTQKRKKPLRRRRRKKQSKKHPKKGGVVVFLGTKSHEVSHKKLRRSCHRGDRVGR